MSSSADRGKEKEGEGSHQAGRSQLEEAMEKLGLTEEEATPLVVEDADAGVKPKWMLAGKIMYRHTFHIQMIASALWPAWGNLRGLEFKSVGENTFVAGFESQRDRDHVRDGAPWHVSKNAVILEEFVDCMQPSELKFDRLQLWVRVLNLPFNLRTPVWGKAIAKQIDKTATQTTFDPVGGLRALDERKKSNSTENSSREQFNGQNSKWERKFSSNAREPGAEVNFPVRRNDGQKRKVDKTTKVYQKVVMPQLPGNGAANANNQLVVFNSELVGSMEGVRH
ncbi:hypothetical protein ACQ4PT_044496 [Festuca glaucescens]